MSPPRDPRALRLAMVLVALPGAVAACHPPRLEANDPSPATTRGASPAGASAAPLEVVIGEPISPVLLVPVRAPEKPAAAASTETEAAPEPEPETLPKTWTGPIVPGLSFADALRRARGARDAYARLTPPAAPTPVPSVSTAAMTAAMVAKEASAKQWFGQAQALADQASRMYAAAFHATDAPREGRIEAIAEAAELDMAIARGLDEAGLGALPVAWRADPAIASTFEDVAVGPTRRWRDEARVLARQCTTVARDSGVLTEAARRCASLRTGAPVKVARRTADADAGAGCACAPGDPLCSASLGGWCSGASR